MKRWEKIRMYRHSNEIIVDGVAFWMETQGRGHDHNMVWVHNEQAGYCGSMCDGGDFIPAPKRMSPDVARKIQDWLLEEV